MENDRLYRIVLTGATGSEVYQLERWWDGEWYVVAFFPFRSQAEKYVANTGGTLEARRG